MSDFVNVLDPEYIAGFRERQAGPVDAVPTPFPTWNSSSGDDGGCKGLARGWFVTIGGNPKQGKTLIALNIAAAALRHGERVGYESLEMSDPALAGRFYALLSGQPITKLQKGDKFSDGALDSAVEAMKKLPWENGVPTLFVNKEPIFDLSRLIDHMHGLDLLGVRWFIVDYIQLVSMGDDDEAVRTVTRAVKEFAKFAKTTGSVVIGLSQFKRSASEDYTRSPMPQGLFGGGAIEQVSDQIVLLDHSLYSYDKQKRIARTWLRLTNRHGQHGEIPILWDYSDLTVREAKDLVDDIGDWPNRKRGK